MSLNLITTTNEKNKLLFADLKTGKCLYEIKNMTIGTNVITRVHRSSPEGNWEILVEFQYRTSTHPTRLVYRGTVVSLDEFSKEMDGKRVFVASNNKQYGWDVKEWGKGRWRVGIWDATSTSKDPTLVAKTHKRHFGIFHKKQKASLEILPPGRPIRDDILVAFCVARILKEKKDSEDGAKARAKLRNAIIRHLIISSIGFVFNMISNN